MRKLYLILVIITIHLTGFNQSIDDNRAGFNIIIGSHIPLMKSLNSDLKELNLIPLKSPHWNFGVGLDINIKRQFLECTYNYFGRIETLYNKDSIGTKSNGFSAGINYGHEFLFNDYLTIIPFVGISVDMLYLQIIEDNDSIKNYNLVLTKKNQTTINNSAMGINMGCQFLIPMNYDNFFVGLKISYTYPIKRTWQTGKVFLNDGPKINPGGFLIGANYLIYF
jgi:hypothetical protein